MGVKRRRSGSSPEPARRAAPNERVLVTVDFGTTFSGLAWVHTAPPNVQTTINMWPDPINHGLEGQTSDKVPTELCYDGQNYRWGFDIPDSRPRHIWFKLRLDPSQSRGTSLSEKHPHPLAAALPLYIGSAEKLVTDYLTALRKHAEQVLRFKLPKIVLESVPIQYILTVPAVWSDLAQEKTRACAEKAGMGSASSLQMISEPEAAAIYALDTIAETNLNIGDTFVLCDAGGGTVDLITYTIIQLKPKLSIAEASPGTGSACGSTFLNRRFQEFLEQKLGGQDDFDPEVLHDAMKFFEDVIKRTFLGTFGETFKVPVPGMNNAALDIRRNKLEVSGTEIRQVFEPVLDEVTKLVIDQMKASQKTVREVILVGGFAQNAYLRAEIRKEVKLLSPSTEVRQSPNGWTAVVRGALMQGLASLSPQHATVTIKGRSARKHYSLAVSRAWNPTMDQERRYYDSFDGDYRISVLNHFVTKGSKVEEEEPLLIHYKIKCLVSKGKVRDARAIVKACSDPQNKGPPTYPDDDGVIELVRVMADLSRIPLSNFPVKTGADGEAYYIVRYSVEIRFFSAHTSYELIHDGKNYGPITAEYV